MSNTCISSISKVYLFYSKIDMESKRNSNSKEKNNLAAAAQEEEEEELELFEQDQQQDGNQEEEDSEILKRRISSHPLYGLLVETHLECLKVGDISNLDSELKMNQMHAMQKQNLGMFSQTELDLFMEAYCLALGQLKEAMEEPQQKSMAFINNMHSQLRDLTKAPPAEPADATSSSSECKFRRNPTI
ncbi:hypothetical protein RIF29_06445 [Crotalaria pallida]|uniref:Uncharacterized protein n=1 Tax=Crotalaria pallida TaxID=3830 RepID=A0AAN9J3G4_CROPI